jgi:hypothetical protein
MKRVLGLILVAALVFPGLGMAQLKNQPQATVRQQLSQPASAWNLIGLLRLDPSRFQMRQSYTLAVGSYAGHTYSQGLYLNTMMYQFSPKLVAQLQLGLLHQPFGNMGSPFVGSRAFVSRAEVLYRPFKNTTLHFQYNALPYAVRDPYGMYPYSWGPVFDERE